MHKHREDLDLIFRRTTPEIVLENIMEEHYGGDQAGIRLNYYNYGYASYDHFAILNFPEYSQSEMKLRYEEIDQSISSDKENGIFTLLYQYAASVLSIQNNQPVCRMEQVLNWNSITSRLGQDLFVTAWLADQDTRRFGRARKDVAFCWPPVLKTDDRRLQELVQRGLAENHFHHHGSTQSFPLSWACLMNHPEQIARFLDDKHQFQQNLDYHVSRGILDNVLDWKERLAYAALIRALLFERVMDLLDADELREKFREFYLFPLAFSVREMTETLCLYQGEKFRQPDGSFKSLDYAICRKLGFVDKEDHHRILFGERAFLYHCFAMQFCGQFMTLESSLFYLYLLIKSNFRSELIQVNKRTGFVNFSEYQDRKNQFFGLRKEYWAEAQRIGICGAMEDNALCLLETRIMPRKTHQLFRKEISQLDQLTAFACRKDGQATDIHDYFKKVQYYVIHFGKRPFQKEEFINHRYFLRPRNCNVREDAQVQAKALAKIMKEFPDTACRIKGIDACSLEIGCRPETFATEFRFLRRCMDEHAGTSCDPMDHNCHRPHLGITFHAGEDFLDIPDGLRAIDETIRFLELKKGDRLGHALALGVNPKDYYLRKRKNIYLTKQDYLDNLVWMLYRSLELNVPIGADHRTMLMERARTLFAEIFAPAIQAAGYGEILELYYQSWKLRGDHPDMYRNGYYNENYAKTRYDDYASYMARDGLDKYRKNPVVAELYYAYHFDQEVKLTGLQPQAIEIEAWYVDLVASLQQAMRLEVFKNEIAIECNPTSNALIGTFTYYDRHPILTFNQYYLNQDEKTPDLWVSINTDDLGVFDTSLTNEYALMFRAIQMKRHSLGNYDDHAIYKYLDDIRLNGISMAFQ